MFIFKVNAYEFVSDPKSQLEVPDVMTGAPYRRRRPSYVAIGPSGKDDPQVPLSDPTLP